MDTMNIIYYLRKILPNIDVISNENRRIITDPNMNNEEKLTRILLNYFNKERTKYYVDNRVIETETKYISKLFPTLPKKHIHDQLLLFRDMPHRVEIVLRMIVQSKTDTNHFKIPGGKRPITTHLEPPTTTTTTSDLYCHPLKLKKVGEGPESMYQVIEHHHHHHQQQPASHPFPPRIHHQPPTHAFYPTSNGGHTIQQGIVKSSFVPNVQIANANCTVTSWMPIPITPPPPKLNNGLPPITIRIAKNPQPFNLNLTEVDDGAAARQNCDSSSQVSAPSAYSLSNSTVVSSSDEISDITRREEENVTTSDDTSAILQRNVNGYGAELLQPLDENKLPHVAQHCTVNSSNETEDVINKSVYLDFLSEFHIEDQSMTPAVDSSNSASHSNEVAPAETKDTGSGSGSQTSQEQTDSEKTILLSPLPIDGFYDEVPIANDFDLAEMPTTSSSNVVQEEGLLTKQINVDYNTGTNEEKKVSMEEMNTAETVEVPDNKDSKGNTGQDFTNIPSTSKASSQNNNMSEKDFNLIRYLQEFIHVPENVIYKQCQKLHLPLWEKPPLPIIEQIVDNLLTNRVSSEDSDIEDDADAVKIVSPTEVAPAIVPPVNVQLVVPETASAINVNVSISENQNPGMVLMPPKKRSVEDTATPKKSVRLNSAVSNGIVNNTQLVNYLCGMFPDACPDYVRSLCRNKPMNSAVVDELTTVILNTNGRYPKRPLVQQQPEVYPENQLDILMEFLPDADPDYLRMMCDRFEGKPDLVKQFLNEAMERKNYPTMKEYQRRQQLSAQQRQYTTEFSVENFIKLIPEPHKFFSDPSRVVTMTPLASHYALVFLRNTFSKLPVRVIQSTFTKCNSNLFKTYNELQKIMTENNALMKSTRKPIEMPNGIQNIPLLQEIAYLSHQKEINEYLQKKKEEEERERQEALNNGLMKTCECCYDEEVLPKDIFHCEKGCSFCKSCIVKSTEVRFGEGKLDFPCLMNCSSQFSLQTLQAVLSPKLFSKIAQKKAVEEVKAAGIEELETCPFCDFATIPAEGYSIFSCLNPDCMKESCRFCKEPSHIPLRCEEIEKDEDVKARTFVENKMTEALLRKCWKCGIKFFKEEGCNKMTCSCGASMCYVCGKPVTDYKHFNGNGGDRFDLCPLYSDTNVLNKENVLKAAVEAKAEVGKELKHDPTADVDRHYKERAAKFPQEQLFAQQQRQAEVFLVRMRNALDQLGRRHEHHHRHHHHF